MIDTISPVHTQLSTPFSSNSVRDELQKEDQTQPLNVQRQPNVVSLAICDCCCKYLHRCKVKSFGSAEKVWPKFKSHVQELAEALHACVSSDELDWSASSALSDETEWTTKVWQVFNCFL